MQKTNLAELSQDMNQLNVKSDRLNGRYRIDKLLGQGAFAEVFIATDLLPQAPGRFISEEVVAKMTVVGQESPEFEFNDGYGYGYQETNAEKTPRELAVAGL